MNQPEEASLGTESSGCQDDQVIDEGCSTPPNTPAASRAPRKAPQPAHLHTSQRGGFGCKYYYPAPSQEEDDPDFIRWDQLRLN